MTSRRSAARAALTPAVRLSELLAGPVGWTPEPPPAERDPTSGPLEATGLIIRPWQVDDARAVFDAYQDPTIQHWHVRSMTDQAEASAWVASWPTRWQDETGGDWAVTAGGAVVGRVGFKRLDLWDGIGELAYWVTPSARGRGVAPPSWRSLAGRSTSSGCIGSS